MVAVPPEIVVTGSALPVPAGAAAYSSVTIDRDRLTATASGRIEDALKDVAGLAAFRRTDSRSANPTSQGVTLRALGGNASSRALVLLDGVPLADPFAGYIPWTAVDPRSLVAVRVTRGGGAGAFGAGAVAGTVELFSAGADALPQFGFGLGRGSRASLSADAGGAARLGGGFVTTFARYDRGNGYILIPARQRGPVDIAARYESVAVGARAVVPVSGSAELQTAFRAFRDIRTRGLDLAGSASSGADASVALTGHGDWGYKALAYAQFRNFAGTFASVAPGRASASPSLAQDSTPATGIGSKIELRPPVGDAHTLQIGVDARRGDGTTHERFRYQTGDFTRFRSAGGATATFGGFVEDSWRAAEWLTLTGGARLDRWIIEIGHLEENDSATGAPTLGVPAPARSGWRATARGGAVLRPWAVLDLRAAAYTGFRLPTPNELYRPFRVGNDFTGANPALGLERVRGVEAGADWRPLPAAKLSVTGYWNDLRGAIANVTLGTGPGTFPQAGFIAAGGAYRVRQNLDAVRTAGVEADASVTIAAFDLTGSVSWSDPRNRASGSAAGLNSLRPANAPQLAASGTVAWSRGPLALSATLRRTAAQYDDDQNLRRIAPATTVDALARLRLGGGVTVEARAENLGDTLVVSGIAADGIVDRAQPRTLWLGLRWERR